MTKHVISFLLTNSILRRYEEEIAKILRIKLFNKEKIILEEKNIYFNIHLFTM